MLGPSSVGAKTGCDRFEDLEKIEVKLVKSADVVGLVVSLLVS